MSTATGTYFDGEVARGRPVTLDFSQPGQLHLLGEGLDQTIELSRLKVSDRLGDVPRFVYLPDHVVIESPDNDVIDRALGEAHQSRLSRLIHVLESQQRIAAAACVVLVLGIVAAAWFGPPVLARVVAHRVPVSAEQKLGNAALAAIAPYFVATSLSTNERRRVERQLDRVLAKDGNVRPRLEFRSMRGGLPNAFALPGSIIVVTDELVRLPASDDELAAVLAHELGHLRLRHGLQSILRQSFAVLFVSAITGDVSALTSFATALPLTILTAGYSRDVEREADQFAFTLLRARGIPPRAFVTVLSKLDSSRQAVARTSTYLSTHPGSDERMALFGGMTPAEQAEWQHLERARALNGSRKFAEALLELAPITSAKSQTAEFFYERGVARHGNREQPAAIEDFTRAIQLGLTSVALERTHLTLGAIHLDQGEVATAIRDYDAAIAVNETSPDGYYRRAIAHRRAGQTQQASADLDRAQAAGAPPDSIASQRAHLAWDRDQYASAMRQLDDLLARRNDYELRRSRAMLRFALSSWALAEADLDTALSLRKNADPEYSRFFIFLARQHRGADPQKKTFAAAIAPWSEGWAKCIGRYLAGEMTEQQLLAEAGKDGRPTRAERRCEAHFYIGEVQLLAGDKTAARQHFTQCVATEARHYYEHHIARARLDPPTPIAIAPATPPRREISAELFKNPFPAAQTKAPPAPDQMPVARIQYRPIYPTAMRDQGVSGEVLVDFLVDRNGDVQNAEVVRSTRPEFEAPAIAAVQQWKFDPGRKNSAPVVTHMQVPVVFTLDEPPPVKKAAPVAPKKRP